MMPESIDSQYAKIGRIAKAHGLDGTVVIIPEVNGVPFFESGELVRLENETGDLIPARIETSRLQQKNDRRSFLVKFAHIADRNQARQLRKMPVFINREKVDQGQDRGRQPLYELTNYTVRDEAGREKGVVEAVLDNPAHPILAVNMDGSNVLVPVVDEYITGIDEGKEVVYCQKLKQLAEIS